MVCGVQPRYDCVEMVANAGMEDLGEKKFLLNFSTDVEIEYFERWGKVVIKPEGA